MGALSAQGFLLYFASNYIVFATAEVVMIDTAFSIGGSVAVGAAFDTDASPYGIGVGLGTNVVDLRIGNPGKVGLTGLLGAVVVPGVESGFLVNSDLEQLRGEVDHLAYQNASIRNKFRKEYEADLKKCEKYLTH